MPYVTEEIYSKLGYEDSIMISEYPKYNNEFNFKNTKDIDSLIELIKSVRKVKLDYNLGKDFSLELNDFNNVNIIEKMLKVDLSKKGYSTSLDVLVSNKIIKVLYNEKEKDSNYYNELKLEISKLEQSIQRRENLLNNKGYISKAPSNIVEKEKQDLIIEKEKVDILRKELS